MSIKIKAIFISTGHDFKGRHGKGRLNHGIEKVDTIDCVAGSGILGDRYFNYKEDFKGQITFFDWAIYKKTMKNFGLKDLDPSLFRRNVLTEGVDLNTLIGEEFEIQGVQFRGSEECAPCYWMDQAISPGAEDFLKGRGGLRARIVTSGKVSRTPF